MDYRTAGFAVFWLTLLSAFAWSAYGRIDIGAVFLVVGILATEMAFLASRLEQSFPWPGKIKLGILSAEISARQRFSAFDAVRLSVQPALSATPFVLYAHGKKTAHAKKNLARLKNGFSKIEGLEEIDIKNRTAVAFLRDEKNLAPSVAATIALLERVFR